MADVSASFPDAASIPADLPEASFLSYAPHGDGGQAETPDAHDSAKATLSRWLLLDDKETKAPAPRRNVDAMILGATEPTPAKAPETPTAPLFKLEKVIGRGGMGEVWQAIQVSLGRTLAVKRVLPSLLEGVGPLEAERMLREMRQEAVLAARLEHPNILPVHDLGIDDAGRPLIAMKLVEGSPWDKLLTTDFTRYSAQELLAKHLPILTSMAQAVAFAHDRGVVHRDLKPAQVMVGRFGEVLLMDWGLAITVGDAASALVGVDAPPTRANASNPAGTPALMAPEQTRTTADGIGSHTDVFLLGGTLYFLLTGTFPYSAPTSRQAFAKAMAMDQERPERRAPLRWIPTELADLAMRALEPVASARVASATAFVEALDDYATGASKRRESATMTDQAAETLIANPTTYRALNEVIASLNRAHALWAENPAEPILRNDALIRATRLALASRDLTLARTQAEQIGDETVRTQLLERIDEAEQAVDRQTRQRRLAIATAIGLLVIVLVGGATFTWRLNDALWAVTSAREETEAQRDRARGARAKAEDLVQFMIGGLRTKLAPLDPKLTMLDEVAARAYSYYSELSLEELGADERMVAMQGLEDLSGVFAVQGDLTQAIGASALNLRVLDVQLQRDPGDLELTLARLDIVASYGRVVGQAGRLVEAREILMGGVESADGLAVPAGDAKRLALSGASLELELAAVDRLQGQIDDAIGRLARARTQIEPFATSGDLKATELLASTFERLDDAQTATGDFAEAAISSRRSLDLRIRLAERDPRDLVAAEQREFMRKSYGLNLVYSGRRDEGIAVLNEAREAMDALTLRDPANTNLVANLAVAEQLLAQLYNELGRHDEMAAIADSWLKRVDWLRERDPTNRAWSFGHLNALTMKSKIAWGIDADIEAAIAGMRVAVQEASVLAESDATDLVTRGFLAHLLFGLSNLLDEAGRWEEAADVVGRSVAVYSDLVDASPDHAGWRSRAIQTRVAQARLLRLVGRTEEAEAVREGAWVALKRSMSPAPSERSALGGLTNYATELADEEMLGGNVGRAGELLEALDTLLTDVLAADRFVPPFDELDRRLRYARISFSEWQGDVAAVATLLAPELATGWEPLGDRAVLAILLRGRLRLHEGRAAEAVADAQAIEAVCEDAPLTDTLKRTLLSHGLVMRAAATEAAGDRAAALTYYEKAMQAAPTPSHRREILDEWRPVPQVEVLRRASTESR